MFYLRLLIIFWKTVPQATLARQSPTLFLWRETELKRSNGKAATTIWPREYGLKNEDKEEARSKLNIPPLYHTRQVAAATVLYGMHTSLCPFDLKTILPWPFRPIRTTRASLRVWQAMPWKSPNQERTLLEEVLSTTLLKSGAACRTKSWAL